MIFDTHAHYDDDAFSQDREDILARFSASGICGAVDVAASAESIDKVLELAEKHDFLYCALGIHPSECADMTQTLLAEIEEKLRRPKVVAVGEIGLDYHWEEPDRKLQQYWFRKQIEMAERAGLPIVIHSRDAARDTFDILMETDAAQNGCVMHCYSYSAEMAVEYTQRGYFLGVGGVVTFKNARKLKEAVQAVPIESIVLETDCPYLAPVPHRGERNCSLYLPYVVEEIARLKDISPQEVIDITHGNAARLYRL